MTLWPQNACPIGSWKLQEEWDHLLMQLQPDSLGSHSLPGGPLPRHTLPATHLGPI